jgi:hypothetical protein
MKTARSKLHRDRNSGLRAIAAFTFIGAFLIRAASGAADPFVTDSCAQQVSARQVLESATSEARRFGYAINTMFMEFEGPMQWKKQLAGRCLWIVYFGCEPPHASDQGYEGCIDYLPELWLLFDSGSGKILHSARYTGRDARLRIDK